MDLNPWLHEHLGLTTVNAEHLNGLVYHPRHGGLCRRLLTLLVDTSLSSIRHPGANVDSELKEAQLQLENEQAQLEELKQQVRDTIGENERVEHEVWQLKEQLSGQQNLNQILSLTNSILSQIENRPKAYRVLSEECSPSNVIAASLSDDARVDFKVCSLGELTETMETMIASAPLSQDQDQQQEELKLRRVEKEANILSDVIARLLHKCQEDLLPNSLDPKNCFSSFTLDRSDFGALL